MTRKIIIIAVILFSFFVGYTVWFNVTREAKADNRLRAVAAELPRFNGVSLAEAGGAHDVDCYEEDHSWCLAITLVVPLGASQNRADSNPFIVKFFSDVESAGMQWIYPISEQPTGNQTRLFVRNNRKYKISYGLEFDQKTIWVSLVEY